MTPEREAQMREMFQKKYGNRPTNDPLLEATWDDRKRVWDYCLNSLEPKWQPIETAPKFGEPIDIWCRHGRITDCVWGKPTYADGLGWIHEAGYDSNGPVFEFVVDPAHWMPLPQQPTAAMSAALEDEKNANE
ncbi:hypothetical protein LMG19089_02924 [Ralstonia edaphis]|uniref:hypothetical protein n=1 Tax=Ralstonia edaphi TaxID=3058599 RepID=UPI0028F54814|nr:hypothetical protein [Ralstonia sp. LMG 6871]CAJ0701779.1 hypothetical protein LMG19089_02924 [Ralstonia sp. LMG 6871]